MSALNNIETPGIATVKYRHTANRSNIKYQCWDVAGLKEFLQIASLIKIQHSEQYRRQMEQNYKNHIKNKLNCIYGIITNTPFEHTDLYPAYNDLSSDEDETVSAVQNKSTYANHNIAEYYNETDGDEYDLPDDDIENQMNAPTQEIVNDDGKLT